MGPNTTTFKMKSVLLMCFIVSFSVAVSARFDSWKKFPRISYRSVTPEYESRTYHLEGYWGAWSASSGDFENTRLGNFGRLMQYVSGDNESHKKIPILLPVITETHTNNTHAGPDPNEYRMIFVLGKSRDDIPKPRKGSGVWIEQLHFPNNFHVVKFPGYPNQATVAKAEKDLLQKLEAAGEGGRNKKAYGVFEYDHMLKFTGRRNELFCVY